VKVLVTGATGFIGDYVIKELLKQDIEVIATSSNIRKATTKSWFNLVRYIEYKIAEKDSDNLFKFFEKPDKIIHLAWQGLPNYRKLFHIEDNLPRDYHFLKNLAINGLKDFTVTGTCFEYGMAEGCLDEEMPANPQNAYSIAKDSLRRFLFELQNELEFEIKWMRLFYMYGKGQAENSLISQLNRALENNDKVFNMSGGEQIRDFLPVQEVATNIVKLASKNSLSGIFNCSSNNPVKLYLFVENYLKKINEKIELNLGYYPYSPLEPMCFWGNNKKMFNI